MTRPCIAGGGDGRDGTELVAAVIKEASLCWRCIVAKCHMTPPAVDDAIRVLRRTVTVDLSVAPCDGCSTDTLLYRLA